MDQALSNVFQWIEGSGLALVIVVGLGWFLVFRVWPRYNARQDRLDAEAKERQERLDTEEKERRDTEDLELSRRHTEYMKVIADFSTAMQAVNVTMSSLAQLVSGMTDRIDDHHEEVMAELRNKR